MNSLLKKKRIYQVAAPPETIAAWEKHLDQERTRWGRFFKTNEEFEFFTMLPLNDGQRKTVLQALIEERNFEDDLKACTGKKKSSSEHRKRCIACCCVEKAGVPFFSE